MQFRILGPLEVVKDGEILDLGARKQRSLLALLLIHANRVVSTDRILEELWGEEAAGKENALWVYISRLRAILEPDREERGEFTVLVTRDHGYVLKTDSDSIDARVFEKMALEGAAQLHDDPATAASAIESALELWRGEPLQDFAYDDFAGTEITRLAELRLNAIEDRIDADLRRGLTGELVGELETFQRENPLRERPVGQLMLALYRAGRSADALRAFQRFREEIGEELGIDPSPELARLEEQILLHDTRLQPMGGTRVATARRETANPFKGLRAFGEEDADDFFGRDRLIAEIVRRLADGSRLTALVGASGSGKSSAVRAGLIPALRKGAIPGSDEWLIAQMVPGSHPFAEVEAALLRSTLDAPDSLTDQLQGKDDSGLLRALLRISPTDSSRVLLVIDQFEELFTLVADEEVRQRFLDNLVAALDDPHGRFYLVLTLRADFYDRPLGYHEFGSRLGSGIVNVVPLSPDELESAIEEPARRSGVVVESGLLAELITDVVGQPGALPMFQYTLTELFDRRSGDVLTAETYREMGGVKGALTRRAEDLFAQLSPYQQGAAQQLFLRLVSISDTAETTRRRVLASEIVSLDLDVVETQAVIDLFGSHRLLSFDRDQISGAPTLEVAHEALLREWERLRDWVEDGREDLQRQAILAAASREWKDSGRDGDYLYTGTRLTDFEVWRESTTMVLTVREREFLDEAAARRKNEIAAEEARAEEARRLRRSARTRPLIAAGVVLVVVAAALVVVALRPGPSEIVVVTQASQSTVDSIRQGLEEAANQLGVKTRVVVGGESEIRDAAEDGADLILFDPGVTGIENIILAHPSVAFATTDDTDPPLGVRSVVYRLEQGSYPAGVAAAFASRTDIVGFLGPIQNRVGELFRAGFEAGARAVNPDIRILSTYIGSDLSTLVDDDGAQIAASRLYSAGADVVFSLGNTTGAAEAAFEHSRTSSDASPVIHRWVIAVSGTDAWLEVADHLKAHVLSSMLQLSGTVTLETIRSFEDDTFAPGVVFVGIDDGFTLAEFREWLPSESDIATTQQLVLEVMEGRSPVDRHPRGLVLSPGFERPDVSIFATLAADGTCVYAANRPPQLEAEFRSGDLVGVDFLNFSEQGAALGVISDGKPGLQARAKSGEQAQLFFTVGPGTYSVDCLADADDPGSAIAGDRFTVQDPNACPPEVGRRPTVEPATPIERWYQAINDRDFTTALSLFTAETILGYPTDEYVRFSVLDYPPSTVEISNILESGSTITWDEDWYERGGFLSRTCGMSAEIENGKITRIDDGTAPGG